jgi:hypothetical protein
MLRTYTQLLSGVSSFYGGPERYARSIPPSEISPESPSLSDRLVEIDRRLREIQGQLAPDREPAPPFMPAKPDPDAADADAETAEPDPDAAEPDPDAAEPDPDAAEPDPGADGTAVPESRARGREGPLAAALASRRADDSAPPAPASDPVADQLDQLAELQTSLLSSMTDVLAGFHRALAELEGQGREITISAGPFGTLEALREFERRLSSLDGVGEVAVRGYEGDHRAVIDVRLDDPTT